MQQARYWASIDLGAGRFTPGSDWDKALRTAGADSIYYATRLRGASNGLAKRRLGFVPRKLEWLHDTKAALGSDPSNLTDSGAATVRRHFT